MQTRSVLKVHCWDSYKVSVHCSRQSSHPVSAITEHSDVLWCSRGQVTLQVWHIRSLFRVHGIVNCPVLQSFGEHGEQTVSSTPLQGELMK